MVAYAKLTQNTRFSIEYLSTRGALRYYYPDFIVRLSDDTHVIVETKGLEAEFDAVFRGTGVTQPREGEIWVRSHTHGARSRPAPAPDTSEKR